MTARRLTQRELRALNTTPGLVVTRYNTDGQRAAVHELGPEGPERRRSFARGLTNDTKTSEEN
jgi:hypothetical protein